MSKTEKSYLDMFKIETYLADSMHVNQALQPDVSGRLLLMFLRLQVI